MVLSRGRALLIMRFLAALKTEIFPVHLHTSAGEVTLKLYDSQLHAKGGLPATEFFKTADAALLFYDITKKARFVFSIPSNTLLSFWTIFCSCFTSSVLNGYSYDDLEAWYDALQDANNRKGSAPLPVIVVGSKLDLIKDRVVKPKDLEFLRTKQLPYLEISSKADYKLKELLLGVVRALCG